jgi:enamine deaminase RidA (YjgF/YER057c/UK114 family)
MYRIPMEEIMGPAAHRPVSIAPGGAYALAYEVARPERTVYVSGQVPEAPDGTVPATFAEQARVAWANVGRALAAAGMTYGDLVKVTIYLGDRRYRADNARVRREVLGDHLPALTVVIAGIYDPVWLLEIEAIAAR